MTPVTTAYLANRAALGRFVWLIVRNTADVEDILQEAYLRASRAEHGRPIEQPKPFLFRIAKHLALTHRVRVIRWSGALVDDDQISDSTSPEDEVIAMESASRQFQAIADLTPGCRRVYELRQFGELSHKEIAQRLGIAVSTVEKHLIRANADIRRIAA